MFPNSLWLTIRLWWCDSDKLRVLGMTCHYRTNPVYERKSLAYSHLIQSPSQHILVFLDTPIFIFSLSLKHVFKFNNNHILNLIARYWILTDCRK